MLSVAFAGYVALGSSIDASVGHVSVRGTPGGPVEWTSDLAVQPGDGGWGVILADRSQPGIFSEKRILMMPGLIFMALPILCYQEGHVTIDLMDGFIPKKAKRWQALVVNLIATVAVAFIAWRLFVLSSDHALNEDVTDTLYISLAPISMFMAIMSTVAALALLLNVGGYVLNRREPPDTAVLQAVKDAND